MGNYSSKDVGFVLVGGYDLRADSGELRIKTEQLTDRQTSLGDSWEEHALLGLSKAEVVQSGYFNDAVDGGNAALVGLGASRVMSIGIEGNTVGRKFLGFQGAMQVDYERLASLSALHRANAMFRGSGQVDRGVILHALGARTADGNSEGADSVDNGALSAGGGVAYLHVVAYTGFTSVVVKVRHSSDDVTYADLVTFASVTAIGAERATVGVTVNRHLAVDWNVTGSGSITFMVGFRRNN